MVPNRFEIYFGSPHKDVFVIDDTSFNVEPCSMYLGSCNLMQGSCAMYLGSCNLMWGSCSMYLGSFNLMQVNVTSCNLNDLQRTLVTTNTNATPKFQYKIYINNKHQT